MLNKIHRFMMLCETLDYAFNKAFFERLKFGSTDIDISIKKCYIQMFHNVGKNREEGA